MPSSVGNALLLFGILLAVAVSGILGVAVGALGLLWEAYLFYLAGRV